MHNIFSYFLFLMNLVVLKILHSKSPLASIVDCLVCQKNLAWIIALQCLYTAMAVLLLLQRHSYGSRILHVYNNIFPVTISLDTKAASSLIHLTVLFTSAVTQKWQNTT